MRKKSEISAEPKILHFSKNRVRLEIPWLNKKIDQISLSQKIQNFSGVKSVRINPKIRNLIVNFDKNFNGLEFLNFLNSLNAKNFKLTKISAQNNHKISHAPSKKPMFIAFSALAFNLFAKSHPLIRLISTTASIPLMLEGTKELFKDGLTSKVLEAFAVFISLYRSDFLAANSTNAMLAFGEYMEESTIHKSDDLIKELAKPTIEKAWVEQKVAEKSHLKLIEAKNLQIGDIVVVASGDIIAVDGHIIDGEAYINQMSMTGESDLVLKKRGDSVISGTIVENGKIKIYAEYVGENTTVAKIKQYISASLDEKSQIGLKATKLADKLVPITFGLAGASYLISRNMTNLASILQADYSCALKLPTPVAFKSSISKAGKNGILVKGAKSLEALCGVDTFVFDKTGTLTCGNLEVVEINSFDPNISQSELLNITASAEEHYFHPVAEAIVEAAKERGFIHMHHDEVEFIVSHGVKTHINNELLIIGSRHFLEEDEKIDFSAYENQIKTSLNKGLALLYIAFGGKLLGTIALSDKIRQNAKETLQMLRKNGVKEIIMLTGDIKSKAENLAKELEIDRFFSDMLPTDKAKILENLKAEGKKIAFVGDGINDAPSLMKADVGISMSKGAQIAKASADISLLKDDICAVLEAKKIANATMSLVERNFKTTLNINSAILFGATFGMFSPMLTAFLHNGTTIWLLINSIKGINFGTKTKK